MTTTPLPTHAPKPAGDPTVSAAAPSRPVRRAFALAALLLAAGLAVLWDGFTDLCWLAYHDPESSHILLIPPLLAYLFFQRRDAIARACAAPGHGAGSGWLGLPVLALAVLAWEWGYRDDMRVGGHLAVVFWAIGSLVVAFGHRAALRIGWPMLGLILLAVPIPYTVRIAFAVPAQRITAAVAEQALILMTVPVVRTGSVLHLGDTQVGIAEACNGMRMLFAVVLICYAYAVATPMRWWARIALLLLSPAIALACNVVRVVAATWVYGAFSDEAGNMFHDLSGWGTAALAFGVVWTIGHFGDWLGLPIYRDAGPGNASDADRPGPRASTASPPPRPRGLAPALTLAGVALLAGAGVGLNAAHLAPVDAGGYHQHVRAVADGVPYQLGEHGQWLGVDIELPPAATELLSPNVLLARRYEHVQTGEAFAFLFIHCYDARDMLGHYPPVCYPGSGWELTARADHGPDDEGSPITAFDFRRTLAGQAQSLRVLQQFLTPDARPALTMRDINPYAGNHRTRHFGMAQWQIVLHPDTTRDRESLENQAETALRPAVRRLKSALQAEPEVAPTPPPSASVSEQPVRQNSSANTEIDALRRQTISVDS